MLSPIPDEKIKASSSSMPSAINGLLAEWKSRGIFEEFSIRRHFRSSPARCSAFPKELPVALAAALENQGISSLYTHQVEAVKRSFAGEDLVISTQTASGKSLCYTLPVFSELLANPSARALYLFPTKALARDQVHAARDLSAALEADFGVAVYDGDSPPSERKAARERAHIVATNPDMLHSGILPNHPAWRSFFAGLRYIVIDELHIYRGVFGSHVANVMRRLLRIAAFYGAKPQIIATTATIGNPQHFATQIFGRPVSLIDQNGAPIGEREFLIYNPPVIDPALGLRESYFDTTKRLTLDLIRHNIQTLVFCRSRMAVEVLVRKLREDLPPLSAGGVIAGGIDPENESRVRGYRGGYLPNRRREIEKALKAGTPAVVVTTSALELGIDIGTLDAVVLAGWPGSRAATWQRMGRAGRRLDKSLALMVASSDPIDQHIAHDGGFLFDQKAESAHAHPNNPSILMPHLKAAAFELPFTPNESFGDISIEETSEVLDCLTEAEILHRQGGHYHFIASQYPANDFSIRGILDENFLVIDNDLDQIIAEVDYRVVPETIHPHAIYQLEGKQYLVERLDHADHKAYVQKVEVDYYTTAMHQHRLRVLDRKENAGLFDLGEVHLMHKVVGFKKLKVMTHENIGYGDVSQPERELHTTAFWFTLTPDILSDIALDTAALAGAMKALAKLLHSTAVLMLMCDREDLGKAIGDASGEWNVLFKPITAHSIPALFLFDSYPGGIGLCEGLFDRRDELLERALSRLTDCDCEEGCFRCTGILAETTPVPSKTKANTLKLLRALEQNLSYPMRPNFDHPAETAVL